MKFTVDLGRSPVGILVRQAPNKNTNLLGDLRPPSLRSATPTPEETEAGAVPADDGLRLNDHEDIDPAGPYAGPDGPEEPVQPIETGTRPFPFEDGDLLSESQNLHRKVTPTAEEDADDSQDGKDGFDHELTVVT